MKDIKSKPFEERIFFKKKSFLELEKTLRKPTKYVSVNSDYLFMEDKTRRDEINFRKTILIYEILSYSIRN